MRIEHFGNATLYLADCLTVFPELKQEYNGILTDPPYSSGGTFRNDRAVSTTVKYFSENTKYMEFSGDSKDQRSFTHWSALWLGMCREVCHDAALAAVFTDWRQLPATSDALQGAGWIWRGTGVWDKTGGCRPNMGGFRPQCEYFLWGTNGKMDHSGASHAGYLRASIASEKRYHSTSKPLSIITPILGPMGSTILDPFMGSGAVGVACLRTGRRYTGIEINPHYFDVACRRMEETLQEQKDLL